MSGCQTVPPAGEPARGAGKPHGQASKHSVWMLQRKRDAFPSTRNQINALLQIMASMAREL